jgi:hypothetical protein
MERKLALLISGWKKTAWLSIIDIDHKAVSGEMLNKIYLLIGLPVIMVDIGSGFFVPGAGSV